jgi:hypothetical protein
MSEFECIKKDFNDFLDENNIINIEALEIIITPPPRIIFVWV